MTSQALPLFSFTQVELPWSLGPPNGRYLMRRPGDPPDAPAAHVLVFATLGAVERRRLDGLRDRAGGRAARPVPADPSPTPVTTGRVTVIDVAAPFADEAAAERWLGEAGETALADGVAVLNGALRAFRLVSADPHLHAVARTQLLVARLGYGEGEEVADGRWRAARELTAPARGRRRRTVLEPQARLAAALGAREPLLVCEELVLRARLDVEQARLREASLQLRIALDAALAELGPDPGLSERVAELRERRPAVDAAAASALEGELDEEQRAVVVATLGRIEAALRARAVAHV